MQFGLGPLSDLPEPRRGDEILPWMQEVCRRINRRIEGPYVRQTPQGVWISNPPTIFPSTDLIPFELYDDISPGQTYTAGDGTCRAWPLKPDYSRDTTNNPPTIQVADSLLKNVRAYGSHHTTGTWASSVSGAFGWYMPGTDGKNVIVDINRLSQMVKVAIGSGCVSAGATFTPTSVTVMNTGYDPSAGGVDFTHTTYTNYSDIIGTAGSPTSNIVMAWDESSVSYLTIDAPCKGIGC